VHERGLPTIRVSDLHQNNSHESRDRDRLSVSRWMPYGFGEKNLLWVRWFRVSRAGYRLSNRSWRHITRLCELQSVVYDGLLLEFREFDMFAQQFQHQQGVRQVIDSCGPEFDNICYHRGRELLENRHRAAEFASRCRFQYRRERLIAAGVE
jgi:hypothetical protein